MSAAAQLRGLAAIPEAKHAIPPTAQADIDAALSALKSNKERWVQVGIPARRALLGDLIDGCARVAERWIAAALKAKGIPLGTPAAGEEWLGGPLVLVRNLRLLRQSLADVEKSGAPQLPAEPWTRAGGQVVAPVFPTSFFDKLLFGGFRGEVWMHPDVTLTSLRETQAVAYRHKNHPGKVALVLGAGNVASIGPMDVIYKLFVEDQVVVLKMNPVNEYLGPFLEEAFRALVSGGFLRFVYGGAAEGIYLCQHPDVDEIHITGSDKTHDAIVFGPGAEGARRKAERRPLNLKRITSELGNVSPVIVVPGPWSADDLRFQGTNLASMLTNNAGFNCNATRVIIQQKGWSQREALLGEIRRVFSHAPTRVAYYPGAEARFQAFVDAHPDAERLGTVGPEKLPWTLISGLDPAQRADICLTTEAFCSVTSEVAFPADSVVDFIDRAVDFCNNDVWGTLNAALIVHPQSLRDPTVAAAVERAIANLKYGSVGVNQWPALAYGFVSTTWGAFPGHDIYDIQSGIGVVHNTYLFDRPQKAVVRGPFRVRPTPPWFVTHRRVHELGPKLVDFEARPSAWKIPSVLWSAVRA
jgi:acyl-CoA reductase-like NAD-dependent aldehyde dehydrogenase